ncbi:MAG: Hsp20/alpha crystallin family protein [Anaerolineales bacterium]
MYRRYRMPSVWREMDQLQREMNRLVGSSLGTPSNSQLSFPAINIWTGEDEMLVSAELPGIKADDIDLNITADSLVLSGERKLETLDEDARYHRQERSFGKFNRSLQLPFMVDPGKAKAVFKNGILEISLVRAEADKPKKIAVKAG